MKKRVKSLIIMVVSILLLSSCIPNSKYTNSVSSFKDIYYKTTDCIIPNDTLTTLKNLQKKENEERINTMRRLLKQIGESKQNNNSDEYIQLTNWYNGLVFLHDSYKRWDTLTFDDKERIFNEIVLIQNRRHKR